MNHLKILHDLLRDPNRHLPPECGLPFVTISRQAGAGGHLLAYVLMTDFAKQDDALFQGWHVFDKELCDLVIRDPVLQDSLEAVRFERYQPEFQKFLQDLFTGRDTQYLAYKRTFEIVRLLASIGKVILVGRGGSCVTRDLPGCIRVRLVAPDSTRLTWIRRRTHASEAEARKIMRHEDASRRKLVKTFFRCDVDDPLLYDAVWNTASTNMHEIAHSIIEMIRLRAAQMKGMKFPRPSEREFAHFFDFRFREE